LSNPIGNIFLLLLSLIKSQFKYSNGGWLNLKNCLNFDSNLNNGKGVPFSKSPKGLQNY
jgi:hypothetical protein